MINTNLQDIVNHLKNDLLIEPEALVWLHSGVIGMGVLDGGIVTLTNAFEKVLVNGMDNEVLVFGRTFYENGQIRSEGNYNDGEKDGKWIQYYENGQIKWKGNYKGGKEEGKTTSYYKSGQIDSVGIKFCCSSWGNYSIKVGKWIWYYENGQIKKEKNYDGEENDYYDDEEEEW